MKTGNLFPRPNCDFEYFKPSKIIELMEAHSAKPQKKWGQNFLIDPNIVQLIISQFPEKNFMIDSIGEIGTGFGALTHRLAHSNYPLYLFEIDPFLCNFIESQKYFLKEKHLLIKGDVLDHLGVLSSRKIFLFGNLPYYITSEILTQIMRNLPFFQGGIFMVQKEFADRLTKEISSISVFISAFCKIKMVKRVSKKCFFPAPKEESAFISLIPQDKRLFLSLEEVKDFEIVLKTFFWGKRKSVYTSAKEAPFISSDAKKNTLCEILNQFQIPVNRRPEEMSISDFHLIGKEFAKRGMGSYP